MRGWWPGPALEAFHDGVTVICELAAQLTEEAWAGPSACPEWRVADLAGHLRCVADDYQEYLDDAPVSRLARLTATGVPADTLARKLARQNAAELAALPDVPAAEHIAACNRRVTLPMQLGTDSLNVAVAAGIFLYHFTRE